MTRKVRFLAGTSLSALLLAAALSSVRGDARRPGLPPARRVTIDGKTFLQKGGGGDDFPAVRREFETFAPEIPGPVGSPPAARTGHSVFHDGVSPVEGPPPAAPPPLPPGLTVEHSLRLASSPGTVDLVLGRLQTRGASIRHRLVAEGWVAAGMEHSAGSPRLLEKKTGKESAIVCLDEAEGTFLLVRESGR